MRGLWAFCFCFLLACGPDPELASISAWTPAPPPPESGWVDEPADAGDLGADAHDAPGDIGEDSAGDADADGGDDDTPDVPSDPCTDGPGEPNEIAADAFPVNGDLTLEARICAGDVDWYALRIPAGASASARIEFSHDEGDLDLRVWRGETVFASSLSESDVERFGAPTYPGEQVFLLEVHGFDGAQADYRLVVADFGPPQFGGLATGTVRYDDRIFGPAGFTGEVLPRAARSVVVEVVRVADGAVVGRTTTGLDGAFELVWDGHNTESYVARTLAAVEVGVLSGSVQDRTGAHLVYALESDVWNGEAVPALHFLASAQTSMGGAMNIADQLGVGMRFVRMYSDRAGSMSVRWTRGRAFDCGSCYGGDRISLGGAPDDPDHYDDDIVLHELGHWVMHRFSADDNPGGTHRDRQVPPVLAYGEGVAYFLSAMWRDTPTVTDNFVDGARHIDLETVTQNMEDLAVLRGTTDGTIYGSMREEIPAAILWDAYDAPTIDEPFDTVEIGAEGHAEILFDLFAPGDTPNVGPRGIDMVDWLSVASCWRPEITAGLAEIASDRSYPFDPEVHVECSGKSGAQRQTRVAAKGRAWEVVALGSLKVVRVDARVDGVWRRGVCAQLPCNGVAQKPLHEVVTVVVHDRGVERNSWVSQARLSRLLGGVESFGVRAYRTSGMVAR
jgi:hypothetical protein